jgi:hypothetical protein
MHIRHYRQVPEDKRHSRCIRELEFRRILHRHTVGPHLDVAAALHVHDSKITLSHI